MNGVLQERLDVNGIIKFLKQRNDNVNYSREQLLCINRYYFKSVDASIKIQDVCEILKIMMDLVTPNYC